MKTALIKVMLKYDFADDVSIQDIIDEVNNMELPKEYEKDSFEWFGIRSNVGTSELIPYYKFPIKESEVEWWVILEMKYQMPISI